MVTTSTRRPARASIAARWVTAVTRAATEGVKVFQLPTSGVWIATSGTDATTAYVVTETACECYAGAHGDPVCKHRAQLRVQLGTLAPTAPAVAEVLVIATPVATPAARMCTDCLDTGTARIATGYGLSDWVAVPCCCAGRIAA